jgi:putative PIN family toxin of toxin-antitoxin system
MRIVLDTNVVVSAVLTPMGPPGQLLDLVLSGELSLVIEPRIAYEYREVLLRPRFQLAADHVHQLIDVLEEIATPVTAVPWPSALDDASDEIFLATALAGSAVLVTGNMADFPVTKRHGVTIWTPRECLERMR